jgi:drug/metabolite transporter (DMT)-like permease
VALLSLRFATRLPGRRPWIALALAVAGSGLALGGIDVRAAPPMSGLLLVWASTLFYAVWIILSARLSGERRDRLGSDAPDDSSPAADAAVTTALMMSATAAVYAVGGGLLAGRSLDPGRVPADAWPLVIAIGAGASFLAIQTFYAGAHRIGAAKAALLSTVEPPIIVALSYLFLHQTLAPIQLAGAALIIVAVLVAQTSPRPSGAPQPATPLEAEV